MPTPVATPADVAAVQDVLKEVWVTDELTSQVYEDMILFDWIEEVTEYTDSDGLHASVPLKTGRSGGVGSRALGQRLPPADHQKQGKAKFNYKNHYAQVELNGPLVARMRTQRQSAIREIDTEVTNILEDVKHMVCRQLHGDGSGDILIEGLPAMGVASTTVHLGVANLPIIEVGHLYEGMNIDIGTDANPIANAQGVQILEIDDDPSDPCIVLNTAVTVTAGAGISLYGNRTAGGVSNEMAGLRSIISDTSPFGGIDPAAKSYWKASVLENGGTKRALSIPLMLAALKKIRTKGDYPEVAVCDLEQEENYYLLLQAKVQFQGDKNLTSGNTEGLTFARLTLKGDPEARPGRIDFLKKKALFMLTAGDWAWQNQTSGGDILAWKQEYDAFVGRVAKYCELGTNRRKSFATLGDLLD